MRSRSASGSILATSSLTVTTFSATASTLRRALKGWLNPANRHFRYGAHQNVKAKLDFGFHDHGTHTLKNIEEPVRVWKWTDGVSGTGDTNASLPLPDKPSIAVLPFTNMSGDPEQEYFSDGITEDIITELSRFPILYVIARQSVFAFKDEKVDVKEIGTKLGVEYVVEGSVRRAGKRARMTAQLVEADSGSHIWAERYDRELETSLRFKTR